MAVLIQSELDRLKKRLLALSAEVENRVQQAVRALLQGDVVLAGEVKKGDAQIDNMEIALEEECLKTLALHQPVANDLRFIISVLKINNDLERVADFAVNIADRAIDLGGAIQIECPYDVEKMAGLVKEVLRMALDSLMAQDADLARATIEKDDLIDEMHRENFTKVKDAIRNDITLMDGLVLYLSISRYFERMGDLATNIAEDVVYQTEGRIIRHGGVQEV